MSATGPAQGARPLQGSADAHAAREAGGGQAARRVDPRAHGHASYYAFVAHRVSGLLLAAFLPLHFWALGQALGGAGALDRFLALTDSPLVKVSEWALVVLLSFHLAAGLRLLLIEFGTWSGLRKDMIAYGTAFALSAGLAFALALVG